MMELQHGVGSWERPVAVVAGVHELVLRVVVHCKVVVKEKFLFTHATVFFKAFGL